MTTIRCVDNFKLDYYFYPREPSSFIRSVKKEDLNITDAEFALVKSFFLTHASKPIIHPYVDKLPPQFVFAIR